MYTRCVLFLDPTSKLKCYLQILFLSVPLSAVSQVSGPGHLQVLSAGAAYLLHAGLLEDHAVGAALSAIPSWS